MRSNYATQQGPGGAGARGGVSRRSTPLSNTRLRRAGLHTAFKSSTARALPFISVESHLAGGTAANFVLGVISNFLTTASAVFHMREKQIPELVWSDEFRSSEILLDSKALIIILGRRQASDEPVGPARGSRRQGGGAPGRQPSYSK